MAIVENEPKRLPMQTPYKYGIVLLCFGALVNWFGLAENHFEPVRYVGLFCIVLGSMFVIIAICSWINANIPQPPPINVNSTDVHIINIDDSTETNSKPPTYEYVTQDPPSYDVAIKLSPIELLHNNNKQQIV